MQVAASFSRGGGRRVAKSGLCVALISIAEPGMSKAKVDLEGRRDDMPEKSQRVRIG